MPAFNSFLKTRVVEAVRDEHDEILNDPETETKLLSSKSATVLHDGDGVRVLRIQTPAAARYFGKGSVWGIAKPHHESSFRTEAERGKVYIVIIGKDNYNLNVMHCFPCCDRTYDQYKVTPLPSSPE